MLVVVDGVFSMEGDVADLPRIVELCRAHGARLMVDEAHAAGVLGARGASASELLGVEATSTCGWGRSPSRSRAAAAIAGSHEVIEFLRISSRAFLFTAARCRRPWGRRWRRCGSCALGRGPALFASVLDNATCATDCARSASRCSTTHGITPIVPVVVGDDWKAVILWRAVRRRRVRQRRPPPAVAGRRAAADERDGAHDRRARRALDAFASVKTAFEAEHGALPGGART